MKQKAEPGQDPVFSSLNAEGLEGGRRHRLGERAECSELEGREVDSMTTPRY